MCGACVSLSVRVRVCAPCACVHACMRVRLCLSVHMRARVRVCVRVRGRICVRVRVRVRVHVCVVYQVQDEWKEQDFFAGLGEGPLIPEALQVHSD